MTSRTPDRRDGNWLRLCASALRNGWILIVAITVVVVLAGVGYTLTQKSEYESTATLYVSSMANQNGERETPEGLQGLVATYSELATSTEIVTAALRDAQIVMPVADAIKKITTLAVPETTLLEVAVRDTDAALAQRLANGVAVSLAGFMSTADKQGKSEPAQMRIVTPAQTGKPVSPNLILNALWSLIFGAVLATAVVITRAVLDNRLRSTADLALVPGAPPVLAEISPKGLESLDDFPYLPVRGTAAAQSFDVLSTNVAYATGDNPISTILVTSPTKSPERSMVASNLAAALSKTGRSVVLVRADLSDVGEEVSEPGVSSVLSGSHPLDEKIFGKLVPGPLVLGPGPHNGAGPELLKTPRATEMFDELQKSFEHVVIEGPPVLEGDIASVLAVGVEGTLVVCVGGRTRAGEFTDALDQLAKVRAKVIGSVLVPEISSGRRTSKRGSDSPDDTAPVVLSGPTDPIEPAEPIESTGQSESTEPTGPIEPAGQSESTELIEPSASVASTEESESIEPSEWVEPALEAEPVKADD